MMGEQDQFALQYDVSRETIERLCTYEDLLKKWTTKINLVAKSTVSQIWSRHFADSAQVFNEIPDSSKKLCDFGSGGGFPGLVIAALAQEKMSELRVSLVESDVRKASFLVTASREMGLRVDVHADRVESLQP
ncbi:16S rRNA (guanine(527)-N(7))-methyltransferase RsmG, partial [Litoreibacter halocynthiae]|uniref:16S rRNA (guanine(527)-N(7))-methyltransferase RsmG n=1 Tax=Litoreibacter halocynthiae TaxID=1242689 RepID=UPI0024918DB0